MQKYHVNYIDKNSLEDFELQVHAFWHKEQIFEKSINNRQNHQIFTFYEGPPSANGLPGLHHIISRSIKDAFCRYKTQKGFCVNRKAGWDAHGLPIELSVEKALGITKEDIGNTVSIKDYNTKCRETVMQYKAEWIKLTEKMGYWIDIPTAYITCDTHYIESVWNVIKILYEKKLVYKGFSIQPYSPAAGTGLSSHELNQPGCYKDVKDLSIVAQFRLVDSDYLLAWTTTPWTLPANAALAINKSINYVKIKTINRYTKKIINVILAKEAVGNYFGDNEAQTDEDFNALVSNQDAVPWMFVENVSSESLLGKRYYQLLPYIVPTGRAFEIIHADFVSTTSGTGIVHIAPSFGLDDQIAAKKNNIADIVAKNKKGEWCPIVNRQGRYIEEITDFANMCVKDAYEDPQIVRSKGYLPLDTLISIKLKEENKAFLVQKHVHSYPHCWRTDKPILYYPLSSWFIKTTQVKDRLIELNKKINWIPESIGINRFNNWLENIVDWNLSRDRFWGTPLPIWRTKDEKEAKCIGSIEELTIEIERSICAGFMTDLDFTNIDLHRPFIDEVVLVSPSNKPMYRERDLVDVWLDSGAMPYAQFHYPFENQEQFQKNFPADFIAEGVDQTRGWFFTLHALAVMLHDNIAFKNVVVNGFILDKNGQKMSKRLGNTIDPFVLLEKHGPDAVRWYIISNSNIHDNIKFDIQGVEEVERKFFLTLKNTYGFFALYANIDQLHLCESLKVASDTDLDTWIISRIHSTIKNVTIAYDSYNLRDASRLIQDFTVNDLSNWYIRLNRRRFWQSAQNNNKFVAFNILYYALMTIVKLSAPIAPFLAEMIYKNLTKWQNNDSVHLTDFPVFQETLISEDLEKKMAWAQKVSSLAHSIRKKCKIKVRQPLSKLIVLNNIDQNFESVYEIIKEEVNIKTIERLDPLNCSIEKKIIPNFKNLAVLHREKTQSIANQISLLTQAEICKFETEGFICLKNSDKQNVTIDLKDVNIIVKSSAGFDVATEDYISIALSTTITEELLLEGIAREIVNKSQNLRKILNFAVCDKIRFCAFCDCLEIRNALERYEDYISSEIQARHFKLIEDAIVEMTPLEVYDGQFLYVKLELYTENN